MSKTVYFKKNQVILKEGELSFEEEQKKILSERDPKYRAAADCIFKTTHEKPYKTAMKIIKRFKKEGWI